MEWIALALFAMTATLTPGPSNVLVMSSGFNFGVKKSVPVFLGVVLGFPFMLVAVGVGLYSIFAVFPLAHIILKIVGCAYLVYMAWKIFNTQSVNVESSVGTPPSFWHGAFLHWVNPKSWIVAVSTIASFSQVQDERLQEALHVAFIFTSVALPCVGTWLVLGDKIRAFVKSSYHVRWFNRIMAILLVLSVIQTSLS
ncbi:LysE family translocator [Sessilibacter sp. MAH4]